MSREVMMMSRNRCLSSRRSNNNNKTITTKRAVECIYGSNEDELNKIRLMRAFVQTQDPSSKGGGVEMDLQDTDDLMIKRFLQARNVDIQKASAMFLKYLKWRRTFVPNGFISASEIQNDLAQNKMFLQGVNKKGRPITVVFGGRHFRHKGGLEEFKHYLESVVEFALALQEAGCFSVILECVLAPIAAVATSALRILTIGIAAELFCIGQVNWFFSSLYYS
ncbi:unnamed protein product [Camellia sinensis]